MVHGAWPHYNNRLERLKKRLDFTILSPEDTIVLEQEIERETRKELAQKFAGNIARLSLRNRVRILGARILHD